MDNPPAPAKEDGGRSRRIVIRVRVESLAAIFAWTLALILFLQFFKAFKMVLLGLLAATALAAALRPLVRMSPGPRSLKAVLIGIAPPILLSGLLVLTVWQLAEPVQRQFKQWPRMEKRVDRVLGLWSQRLGFSEPLRFNDLMARMGGMVTGGTGKKIVSTTTGIISGVFIAMAFVFIGSIYLMVEPPNQLLGPLLRLLPRRQRPRVRGALTDLGPRLRWWLIGTIVGSLTIGLTAWLGYALIGLEFAPVLALLAGIGEAIPTIGPLVTFLIALLFAATEGIGKIIGVTIVYLVIQGLESYVLMPLIMKKAVNIPPVVTLFTLVLWGTIFGLPGLLLAIPINLVIWSFADHFLSRPRKQYTTET